MMNTNTNMQPLLDKLPQQKNVIAIASGKGGVGKTWLSVSLSHALSLLGKKVLLFDGDLGLANVDIQLGLNPKRNISGLISGENTLEQVITKYKEGGFDIIAGQSGGSSAPTHSPTRMSNLLRRHLYKLANRYDKVIIDLPAGIEQSVRTVAAQAGTYLILANADPTSLTDAYAYIKLTLKDDPEAQFKIVINAARNINEGKRTYQTLCKVCENFLRIKPELLSIIHYDPHIQDSIRHQTLHLLRHESTQSAKDIMALAEALSK